MGVEKALSRALPTASSVDVALDTAMTRYIQNATGPMNKPYKNNVTLKKEFLSCFASPKHDKNLM